MIIFEKNNKLNINFENKLDAADIQIGKSEIKVDGNNIVNGGSGGDSGFFIVTITVDPNNPENHISDKTYAETKEAYDDGKLIIFSINDSMYIASFLENVPGFRVVFTYGDGDDHVMTTIETDMYGLSSEGIFFDYYQADL